ncbi:MAG: peroxiredoxin family protein [Planctomycetes bacterium]|nr:peroxiredoxin family protein [Planctomycetota bacterium]
MTQTFYVAKDDASPLRFTLESNSEFNGKKFTTSAESDLKRLDAGRRPGEGQFRFTPPAGAVRAPKAGEDKLLAVGGAAPEFHLVDAAGQSVRLSDFKGKVVLLNFWFLG